MNLDDRFGDYLLFRKLGSGPLGSTYRAGRLQARAVDRVVLLQRFDGDGIDRGRLADDAADRAPVLDRLTAPQFANGLGLGTEDGVPYVAYDYLLGRTLQETLKRATDMGSPPATAYLVALIEQAAGSLAAASQITLEGVPVRHGFLVPELLLLSAEGRVYLLGFSHGPGLLRQPALSARFAPYLAPETRLGDHAVGDDVYSLAAILFEGLTGSPPNPDRSTATQVDQALLTVAGAPLPPLVQDLLKSGLAPEGSRADLKTFHRSLRRIVDETEDSPSQFQLAFFLHRLFRDELEAEAVEMRDEKTTRFDPLDLAPPPSKPEPAPEPREASDSSEEEPAAVPSPGPVVMPPAPATGSRFMQRPFLSGVALALALAALTTAALQLTRRAPAVAAEEAVAALSRPADPAAEGELRRLVASGAAELTDKLEAEYEPRLNRLREDLVAAQTARRRRELAARRAPAPAPAIDAAAPPAGQDAEPPVLAAGESPTESLEAAPPAVDPVPPERESDPATDPNRLIETAPQAVQPAAASERVAEPASEPVAEPVAGSADPSPGRDRSEVEVTLPPPRLEPARGDATPPAAETVPPAAAAGGTSGESVASERLAFTPPRLLEPPRPRYPIAAQRLGRTARVQVRVQVGPDGRVSETELLSDEVGFGFDKAALQAAARTRWEPARRDGDATTAWAVLTIDFRL